uniref:RNA helicase n=1 Tax=Cacopsylla melanoneura TaxID=428564 RepID=A0A8D9FH90_9HEMI
MGKGEEEEEEEEVEIISEKDVKTENNIVVEGEVSRNSTVETNSNNKSSLNENQSIGKQEPKKFPGPVRPAVFVPVLRKPSIQASRLKLPILAEEQTVMETINEHDIVIVAGETGSGKTTQIPQFLYEAGYTSKKLIGITEPRRVAAISMSRRVAEELNLGSDVVSYLIRFEGNVTPRTKIKFMTDGVLLKEIQSDFLLTSYSVIILDEAHERSVYTDILIGLLSRIVPLRAKRGDSLKLIIMSATLRISDFTENARLFKIPPPVIQVDARQFPVTIHFNKKTATDYMQEAFIKACKIHAKLPEGGLLIFVTGQKEVCSLVRKLKHTFPYKKHKDKSKTDKERESFEVNVKDKENNRRDENEDESDHYEDDLSMKRIMDKVKRNKKKNVVTLPEINLDNYAVAPNDDTEGDLLDEEETEDVLEEEDEEEGEGGDLAERVAMYSAATSAPLWVLPLYSLLPTHKQAKVFESIPEGCRLCVVATNVAETSLTIPNVKYVVDTGRTKTRLYDKITGISAFTVTWTSQASANQRAGRAGRQGPGHCYRLYSSAVFNDEFEKFSVPEIQRKPVDDLLLQMKSMSIHRVVNFPFPSAPDVIQLRAGERRLALLGALQPVRVNSKGNKMKNIDEYCSKLTPLGEAMSLFPVSPRFGKMLCLSHQHALLPYTVAIVAALSVQELLLGADSDVARIRTKWAGVNNSLLLGDLMVLLRSVGAAEKANVNGNMEDFCNKHGLRLKAVVETRKLRIQLTNELNVNIPDLDLCVDPDMPPPTDTQARLLRQIALAGMVDQVARLVPDEEKKALGVPKKKPLYAIPEMEEGVYLHSGSVLRKTMPEWVVYEEIFQTGDPGQEKMIMRGITAIEPEWLPIYTPSLCSFSPPLEDPPPRYISSSKKLLCHVNATFGKSGWPLPVVEIDMPKGLDRFKWFAVFLLDGSICPKLSKYVKSLLSTPTTMVKSWASLQRRTEILLQALVQKQTDNVDRLLSLWSTEPAYLRSEYLQWLPESAHNEVTAVWPPV